MITRNEVFIVQRKSLFPQNDINVLFLQLYIPLQKG